MRTTIEGLFLQMWFSEYNQKEKYDPVGMLQSTSWIICKQSREEAK